MSEEKPKNDPPVKVLRVGGIKASVWKNKNKDGNEFHSVSLVKTYKKGDEWKETSNLGETDIQKAVLALNKAYEYINLKNDDKDTK